MSFRATQHNESESEGEFHFKSYRNAIESQVSFCDCVVMYLFIVI